MTQYPLSLHLDTVSPDQRGLRWSMPFKTWGLRGLCQGLPGWMAAHNVTNHTKCIETQRRLMAMCLWALRNRDMR